MALERFQPVNRTIQNRWFETIEVGEVVVVIAIASVPIAPALFGARGGAFVHAGLALLLLLTRPKMRLQGLLLQYLLFAAWLLIGSMWGPGPSSSLFIFLGSGILAALAVSSFLSDCYRDPFQIISTFSAVYRWSTLAICVYCLAREGITDRLGREVFENGGTYIYLSLNLLIASMLTIWELVFSRPLRKKIQLAILLALLIIFCLLSSTRKVILGLAAFALMLIAYRNKTKPAKLIAYLGISVVLIGIVVYAIFSFPALYETIGVRFETMIEAFLDEGADASMSERDTLREYAWLLFANNKLVGIGTEGFHTYAALAFGRDLYSHCNYSELLCNNGIVGFVLYYTIYALIIIQSIRHGDNQIRALTFCSCVTLIVLDYSQVSYYQIPYSMFLFVLYAINRACQKACIKQVEPR